jgi:hypothetical protein
MYCDTEPAMAPPLWREEQMNRVIPRTLRDTRDSTTITDDCGDDRMVIVEVLGLLKISGIQILGAM